MRLQLAGLASDVDRRHPRRHCDSERMGIAVRRDTRAARAGNSTLSGMAGARWRSCRCADRGASARTAVRARVVCRDRRGNLCGRGSRCATRTTQGDCSARRGRAVMNINMLLVTVGMVLATFMTRAALLLAGHRFKLSPRVEAALRYAPVCALAVLVVPEVVVQAGTVNLSLTNPRLAGA